MKHEVHQVIALMEHIVSFARDLSKGQWLTTALFRYVPGAKEKAVLRIEKFTADCVTIYNNLDPRLNELSMKDWMQFKALEKELRFRLNKLFWGHINDNRDSLDPDHWSRLNSVTIILIDLIIRVREEFDGRS